MQKPRYFIADVCFYIGNTFMITSARLMGYSDAVESLKKLRIDTWRNRYNDLPRRNE